MVDFNELLEAGVHFGHLKKKWNPKMAPYIFMEKNGIHIIDLHKTSAKLEVAASAAKQIAKSGKRILFVATKKQAKDVIENKMGDISMPFVTERWAGGTLTNFPTIRKSVKKMQGMDKAMEDETFANMAKREKLQLTREREKLERNLGSIADLTRLPYALFIVDIIKEHIALKEARRLGIPIFAMVDTNSNPDLVDFPIPSNDDSQKSIDLVVGVIVNAIKEGLEERKRDREAMELDEENQVKNTNEDGEGRQNRKPAKSSAGKRIRVKTV